MSATRAKKTGPGAFVKSASTTASVSGSRTEIERMLKRYGAVGYGWDVDEKHRRLVVRFVVRDSGAKDAAQVPVQVPIDVHAVYDALFGAPPLPTRWNSETRRSEPTGAPRDYDAKRLEQAERVAWRNLVLWIDAALSAAAIGLQRVSESLLAHTMIQGEGGEIERFGDYLQRSGGAIAPGVRALLMSGDR